MSNLQKIFLYGLWLPVA